MGLSAAGEMNLIVSGDLQVLENITAGGSLTATVSGSLEVLENITAGGSVTASVLNDMQVWGNIATGGALTADVSGSLEIRGNITAGSALTVFVSGLQVGGDISAGGDVDFTTVDTAAAGEDIRVQAGAAIGSQGGSVTLRAGDDLHIEDGSLLTAVNKILLYIDFSADNPDPGVGGNFWGLR